MSKKKTVDLQATAAFVLNGEIVRPGAVISIDEALAKNLLHRGRAVLATADEAPAEKPKAGRKAKAVDVVEADEAPAEKPKAGRKAKAVDVVEADEAPAGE